VTALQGGTALRAGLLLAASLSLFACPEVKQCQRGSVGCVDGPPDDAGQCQFDLIKRGNRCIAPSGSSDPLPQPNPCGSCAAGTTCTTDQETCVDFCAESEIKPGSVASPTPIRCGGELKDAQTGERYVLSFDETCVADCQLTCRLREWFCTKGCEADACSKPEVLAECHKRCDADSSPLACMQKICNDTRSSGCSNNDSLCGDGEFPDCNKWSCTNTCATTRFDGVCDDGDLLSARFASCDFGTDCADCGPRVGEDTSRALLQGDVCGVSEQCQGHDSDFSRNEAFCLAVKPGSAVKRCVLDCSGRKDLCPEGTTCTTLNGKGAEGMIGPVRDAKGVEARACLPDACR